MMSTDSSGSEFTSPPLLVSFLSIHVKPQSRKEIETIVVNAGSVKKEFSWAISPGGIHQEQFDPPLEISLHTKILVSVHCRGVFRLVVPISLEPTTVLSEANEKDGKQVYCKTERNIEVSVGIQSLPSTANEVLASCSRFRVLIIGKSGVGKSSLIKRVFGVSDVHVSDTIAGEATIDQEHIAIDNNRFVVHDSCGFEAGDQRNLDNACNFIMGRRRMRDPKDQLHAVWLCLEIPFAGGRVLETGVEEFLKKREQILGNTPLVVVFTKLDSLVNMLSTQALQTGQFLDSNTLEKRKCEALEKHCFGPIRTAMNDDGVPSVAVSTAEDYDSTLSDLVGKTTRNIQEHIKDGAAHYIATMAQRVNITLKVAVTIALGEKRYWNMLKESPSFRGQTMKACLDVLHKDVVTVWNFKDPQNSLYGDDFKEALLKTPKEQDPEQSSVIETLVTIISSLAITAGATFPIVVPLAGAIILYKLAHNLYKTSHVVPSFQDTIRQLMAYIVDLTCVMQILFLIVAARDGEASAEAVGIAMQAYEQTHRSKVHAEINAFPVNFRVVPRKQDDVLDKIKELIGKYRVPDEDVAELQRQLLSAGVPSSPVRDGGSWIGV